MRPTEILSQYFPEWQNAKIADLAGERDLNFKLTKTNDCAVLKIYQPGQHDWLMIQDRALHSLSDLAPHVPQPLHTQIIELAGGKHARLVTWVPGKAWAEVEKSSRDLSNLGKLLGSVDSRLRSIELSAPELTILQRPFIWNMLQAGNLSQHLHQIEDRKVREICMRILEDFREIHLPQLAQLEYQLIHNDGNDYNIMVGEEGVGLIDFGDIIFAPKIIGLATALAYLCLEQEDPIKHVLPLVRAYHLAHSLNQSELALLYPLIKVRLAMSVINAAIQSAATPNNDYLLISQAVIPKLLNQLESVNENLAHYRFRDACGYEANPHSREIRQYISTRARKADVVSPGYRGEKYIYLDWSVANTSIPRWSNDIADLMAEKKAKVAIGHYCEDRNVYQGDAYDTSSPSARTVHLGVDLFQPAGSPVFAALDGEIYAFNNNATPLDYGPVIILKHQTDTGIEFFTLYGHLSIESMKDWEIGKQVTAGQQIATMGNESENVGWPPHTHFQLLTDLCGMGVDVYGVAPRDEVPLWRSISPNPNLALGIRTGTDVHAHVSTEMIKSQRSTNLSRNLSLNFTTPLEIVRGEGAYLFDVNGKKYLDLVNNVAHVGHGNPIVVSKAAKQMHELNTNTRYLHQNIVDYARSLAATLPDPLNVVFLVNSGSEANDLAIRIARAHTRARGWVSLRHAYHGHTASVVDISPYKFLGKGGEGTPSHVRVMDLPRPGHEFKSEFDQVLASLDQPIAGFIAEGIVSTAGQITLANGFLAHAYESVRAAGGVTIADEVQIGLGRVGEKFWGFELHGVVPDIVTMGKPLGNGHPLAAVVTTPELAASFNNGMEYFNTFGGNPVSAAIGQAVLDYVFDAHLQENAINVGNYLMASVRAMKHSLIADVRGHGLFIGVELNRENTPATAEMVKLIEFAKAQGVFLSSDGPANNVLKIKPPMVLSRSDVDLFLEVFAAGLAFVN